MSANYLPVSVYRNAQFPDCSNGGVSSREDVIFVEHSEGNVKGDDVPKALQFRIDKTYPDHWRAMHVHSPGGSAMYGGNLASTTDSRLKQVLHIHDRFETAAQSSHMD